MSCSEFSDTEACFDHFFKQYGFFGTFANMREMEQFAVGNNLAVAIFLAEPLGQSLGVLKYTDSNAALRQLAALDVGNTSGCQQLSLFDDSDHVAHLGKLGQNVRADQDRLSVLGQPGNHLAQFNSCPWI